MSQDTINTSLQKTLISPLTNDSLWQQFLTSISYEMWNMREEYSKIKNNWNIYENDKSNLIRIAESFGYTPNLIINNTLEMAKREIESIPYRIRRKTTYYGYSLILKQNNSLGETFNYYWNDKKLIKVIDWETTVENLTQSNHYSPFFGIKTIKNYSNSINTDTIILDYPNHLEPYYYLDQIIGSSTLKLDTSYIQIPTKHLGLEYFPQKYYCEYSTTLGVGEEDTYVYETSIQNSDYYLEESMRIKVNNILIETSINSVNDVEYFIDENGILTQNSYFDKKNNLIHLEFLEIPIDYEISVTYGINLLISSDYFYYLEKGMDYNRRCPIIPHTGVFLSVDIASSRGSDFYYPNDDNYTVPDLKIKSVTASSYNRFITLTETSQLDNAYTEEGYPSGKENYKLDSAIKWKLDSTSSQNESLIKKFKYISCGTKKLNTINEKYNDMFNQSYIIFYYNLNSDDYTHFLYDCSSNQNNCAVVGNDIKIDSVIDKSLNFDGETYAYTLSKTSLDSSSDYTLGFWFKSSDENDTEKTILDSFVVIKYDYVNEKLIINSNEFNCSKNEYHFVCLVYDYSSELMNVYMNATLLSQIPMTITPSSYTTYIGTDSAQVSTFVGEIDNVWLLSKQLSIDEISYIFENKISLISHMGNRLAYYELSDDEIYEDDNYLLVQSYVKSMDITNEKTMIEFGSDENASFSYTTKFYPIIPSYFSMTYTDSFAQTITVQSDENGRLYNKDTEKTITGSIDFESGTWNLTKNTTKSISQQPVIEINKEPYKKTYSPIYKVIDNLESDDEKWYSSYDITSSTHQDEISADFKYADDANLTSSTFMYTSEDDDSLTKIYSNDEENYYIYNSGEKLGNINIYTVDSDDAQTPLFSATNGKTLYSKLDDLMLNQNQLKSYVDLGESSATTIYSKDGGNTMYLDVACSDTKEVKKYYGNANGDSINVYTLGDDDKTFYPNLSFTSVVEVSDTEEIQFNYTQTVIKSTQGDISNSLTLNLSVYEYSEGYSMNYIQNLEEQIASSETDIIKGTILFYYWIYDDDGNILKKSATVDAQGYISGDNINSLSSNFNYTTNTAVITFNDPIKSDIVVSYDYYYSLDIDSSKPILMNYKVQNSIQINEIGLEDSNHELMAYMTFPNVEFHSIYNNLSALFAIKKSS